MGECDDYDETVGIVARRGKEMNDNKVGRPKLHGTVDQDVFDGVNDTEKTFEDAYFNLREKLGTNHPLTKKAERQLRSINEFRRKVEKALEY